VRARGSLRILTLNNPVNYFLHRGRLLGFDYEVAMLAASRLGVRLEMVVPPSRDQIFDLLLDGRADVIASTLTVTPERQEYLAFSRPYLFIQELVVQPTSAQVKLKDLRDLVGRSIHAWSSSSHYQTLVALRERVGEFEIVPVPEDMEFEEILDRVGNGEYPLAVVDSHILEAELAFRDDVEVAFALADPDALERDLDGVRAPERAVAFAMRPDNPELKSFMDAFVAEVRGGLEYNMLVKRYFGDNRRLPMVKELRAAASGRLSPYDDLLRVYSRKYGLDWRLMAAQAYQESRFDPDAESWAGAQGLFQLLPATGREVGFDDLKDPESGIHAGVRYVHHLYERIDDRIPLKHRMRFALAAYNAGFGHVQDARRLASEMGRDANKWFGHTEEAMLLLRHPEYYQHARYGYVRGSEPVKYVSRIQNLYDHYVSLVPP
jgi:membrane-bound lytic murein transglycosylase F